MMAGNTAVADPAGKRNALRESDAALVFGIAHPKTHSKIGIFKISKITDRASPQVFHSALLSSPILPNMTERDAIETSVMSARGKVSMGVAR